MANEVIARYADGRTLKGTSLDVDPNRSKFHVRTADGVMTPVLLSEIKALFFVKSAEGNPSHVEGRVIAPVDPRLRGARLVEVTFLDGEKVVGLTSGTAKNKTYFFLVPVDVKSNNVRILVNADQIASMLPLAPPADE